MVIASSYACWKTAMRLDHMNRCAHSNTPCDNLVIMAGSFTIRSICDFMSFTTCVYERIGIFIPHFSHTTPAMPQWSKVIVGIPCDIASNNTVVVASPNEEIMCRCDFAKIFCTSLRGKLPWNVITSEISCRSQKRSILLRSFPSPTTFRRILRRYCSCIREIAFKTSISALLESILPTHIRFRFVIVLYCIVLYWFCYIHFRNTVFR